MDLRALPWRGQFPVAIDVAIPVEPAAEAGFLVGLGEIGEVGFAKPIRQRPIRRWLAEKSLAFFDKQRGRRIGKSAPEQGSHRQADIALELGLGYAGLLKILPVEIGNPAFAQAIERPATATERWGNAQAGDGCENIRAEYRRVPGNGGAPIMADNDGLVFSERRDQRDHVPDVIENTVRIDIGGGAGAAKTPHIGRCDMEARRRNRRDLMPPGIGQFRPAMAKQNQRAFALLKHKYLDPVGGNRA